MDILKLDENGLVAPSVTIGGGQLTANENGNLLWNGVSVENQDLSDYVTNSTLNNKGYLTSSSLSGYAKTSDLSSYATTSSLSSYIKTSTLKSYVTETWQSGTSWYRKYSDGWIEQGGLCQFSTNITTISLNTSFSNTNYSVVASKYRSQDNTPTSHPINLSGKTSSSFRVGTGGDYGNTYSISWFACGY